VSCSAGDPAGCRDFDGNLVPADQRYALRIDRCDIGAYAFGGLVGRQSLPVITKD